jgi:UDP-3-O-[3-hydroxymyristoyl] glucosamine N-acyltransferase
MAVKQMTLGEIAEFLEGQLEGGTPETEITSIEPIQEATPGSISFISNRKYIQQLKFTQATAALVSPEVAQLPRVDGLALVILDDPYMGFAKLLSHWTATPRVVTGVSEKAHVDASATLGADVNVAPFVYVGANATVGDRCDLHPGAHVGRGATIGSDTILGPNCVVHHECEVGSHSHVYAGAVIGSDGFGFAPDLVQGLHLKIPQLGNTVIDDHVEIGANTTIDRAAMGSTRVGRGSKIDNQVQMGHNSSVGMGCFVVSQAGISGTSHIGHGVTLAGQVGIAGHVTVGDGAQVGAQAGVHANVPAGARVLGTPAFEGSKAKRSMAAYKYLPQLRKRVHTLERKLAELEKASEGQ